VIVRTHIAYGSPHKQDTAGAHGSPLGKDEVALTKRAYGWPEGEAFLVPAAASAHANACVARGAALRGAWEGRVAAYKAAYPEESALWRAALAGELPAGWETALPAFTPQDAPEATRAASGKVLNALAPVVRTLIGGSADLAPSTDTLLKGYADFSAEHREGRNLHFGIRELGMAGVLNGMALHGGVRPYGATFLVFSDYARPAIRLAALMGLPVVYVFTHDSIGLGEDGPTHQPVEHLAALRAIPGLVVIRPADAEETAAAWRAALLRRGGPTALVLTRQKVPALARAGTGATDGVARGGYVLAEAAGGAPKVVLLGTGSEVALCVAAQGLLERDGVPTRVVSMPSVELFAAQAAEYRDAVLPPAVRARVAVEAGRSVGWHRWVGDGGDVVGLDHFGASAPAERLFVEYGFTPDHVAARARALLR
jgi:transketolase